MVNPNWVQERTIEMHQLKEEGLQNYLRVIYRILKYILIGLLFLFISCSEDPPTIPPSPPPEPYYTCDLGEAKNCTIEENIGACQKCIQRCIEDNNNPMIATIWGGCEQSVFPSDEICDGLDNDCNGTPDEVKPLRCHPPGYEGLGLVYNEDSPYSICQMGYLDCVDGEWEECQGYIGPENEVCDGQIITAMERSTTMLVTENAVITKKVCV